MSPEKIKFFPSSYCKEEKEFWERLCSKNVVVFSQHGFMPQRIKKN
jgi:hypothetical protein